MELFNEGTDRRRFFLITPGRTGSTLLATILADAGADFSIDSREEWDTARGGWMEHADIRRATHHFRLAFERSPTKPVWLWSRLLWTYHRTMGKRYLRRALEKAVYLKAVHLDLAIPFAIKLGYFPQAIVNYRPFAEQALSSSQMLMSWSADALAGVYNRTYRNALMQIHSYGGCVVSHADLTDRRRTAWAAALSEVTGLPADKLLESRDRRSKGDQSAPTELPVLDESTRQSVAAIDALSGLALPPSPQALRNWGRKSADRKATPDSAVRAAPGAGRWSWIDRLKIEAEARWKAIRDSRVPWYIRAIAPACGLAYIIAPIDPIPNSIPLIGHMDDVIVGMMLVALFILLMPSAILFQHRDEAARRRGARLAPDRQP